MRIFAYEVGDPALRPGTRVVFERIDNINWIAVFNDDVCVWRGKTAALADELTPMKVAA